ncbi:hypothetical protein D3C85_856960 [compost metagenome]
MNRNLHDQITGYIGVMGKTLKARVIGDPVTVDGIYGFGFKIACLIFPVFYLVRWIASGYESVAIQGVLTVAGVVWLIAFCIEGYSLLSRVLGSKFFVVLLGLVSLVVVKVSYIWSGRYINKITGLDPSYLPDAHSTLALLFVPLSWIYLGSVLLMAFLMIGFLFSPVFINGENAVKNSARFIVTLVIVLVGFSFADYLSEEGSAFGYISKVAIAGSEYFPDESCSNFTDKEVVARLEGGEVSVFNPLDWTFRLDECVKSG